MLRYLLLSATFFLAMASSAQDDPLNDTTITLDVLTAPLSPASNLLGTNPSEIQKPTEPTGIWTSLRNATNNFSTFPNSFAIDIAPKWVFDKKTVTFEDFASRRKAFAQTFNFSYAQAAQNDNRYTGLKQGVGVSFALIRPALKDSAYWSAINQTRAILTSLRTAFSDRLRTLKDSPRYRKLDSLQSRLADQLGGPNEAVILRQLDSVTTLLDELSNQYAVQAKQYADSLNAAKLTQLKKLQATPLPARKGFFLNMALGTIVKYDSFTVSRAAATNTSVWVTLGWDGLKTKKNGDSYFSVLGLSRYIHDNADELYKSGVNNRFSTWDNGLRLAYTTRNEFFRVSAEGISRKLFDVDAGEDFVFKYLLNLELHVGKNKQLTFSYGKDFANHITREGNVVGYINFVMGLFNKKNLR